jgi:hypothetical protein
MKRIEPEGPQRTLGLEPNARHEPTFPILVSIIGPAGLTAEFGMGSGVTPRVWAPGKKKEQGLGQWKPRTNHGAAPPSARRRKGHAQSRTMWRRSREFAARSRGGDRPGRRFPRQAFQPARGRVTEPLSFVFPEVLSRAPPRKRKWSSQSAD